MLRFWPRCSPSRVVALVALAFAVTGDDDDLLEFGVKLIPGSTEHFSKEARGYAFLLVERSWLTCQWTRVYELSELALAAFGVHGSGGVEAMKEVGRCGPSAMHNCRYYDASIFARLGVHTDAPGFLVEDGVWTTGNASDPMCQDAESFLRPPHPSSGAYPDGLDHWLGTRLAEMENFSNGDGLNAEPTRLATFYMRELNVCWDNVRDAWTDVLLDQARGSQMIIIGSGDMGGNPTQAFIERGAGGLFLDASRVRIREARRNFGAPHRVILNATVLPSNIPALIQEYEKFVDNVHVLQVDIDNMDGPVVMKFLEYMTPKFVVVEVRHQLPFPFRYACVWCDMGLGYGGATLGYWAHELDLRGYELFAMDRMDAVFVRRSFRSPSQRRQRFLAAMACYLRNNLPTQGPAQLLGRWSPPRSLEASREVLDELWWNFSSADDNFSFVLEV